MHFPSGPAIATLALVSFASLALAHLSRLPGRFDNPHLRGVYPEVQDSCETVFEISGTRFNLSSLQVDIGGYIADNNVDSMSYCLNVCGTVTSDRNCVCYPCGGNDYPASQVAKLSTGETCQAYLGDLNGAAWTLLSVANPKLGVALTYLHGQDGRSTRIEIYCDRHAQQYSNPAFVGDRDGVFLFSWNTTIACPY